jgi:copper transport protein
MWHRDVQRRAPALVQGAAAPQLGGSVPGARCAAWRSFVAAAILLGSALAATPAGAHGVPAAMDPAPNVRLDASPPEVVIRFTERVEARPSTLEVLDARGQRVDQGGAIVDPADPWRYRVALPSLPSGAYTVSWRVLSADDGHVTSGAHVFTIGVMGAAGASEATVRRGVGWRPLARWLVAVGGALLLGVFVAGPVLGLGRSRWTAGMGIVGGVAVVGGGSLDLVLQARDLAGARPIAGVLWALLATPPGFVWLARGGLLLLLGIVSRSRVRGSRRNGGRSWIRAGLAAVVVMIGGLVSHVATVVDGRWLVLGAEALHLLAMASWAGGLIAFATVFWRVRPAGASTAEATRLVVALPAFSRLAVLAVGVLAVSGLLLARLHLTTWMELVGTAYGRWLLAKLLVFAAMLALGGWHQGWVEPRLVRALDGGDAAAQWVSRFRRSVRLEAALGLLALAAAGALGVTAPPAPSASMPGEAPSAFRHDRAFDEASVRLEILPLRPGPNAIRLTVTDPAGRALADATAAMVQLTPADASVGALTFQLVREVPGVFVAPSAVLGVVGRWSGRLTVQRQDAYDVNDRFDLVVAESATTHGHGVPDAPAHLTLPLDRLTRGAALVTAVVTLALFLRSRRRLAAARRLLADTSEAPAAAPARR